MGINVRLSKKDKRRKGIMNYQGRQRPVKDTPLMLQWFSRQACHAWVRHAVCCEAWHALPRSIVRNRTFPILPFLQSQDVTQRGNYHCSSCHAKIKMTAFCLSHPIRGEDNACITLKSVWQTKGGAAQTRFQRLLKPTRKEISQSCLATHKTDKTNDKRRRERREGVGREVRREEKNNTDVVIRCFCEDGRSVLRHSKGEPTIIPLSSTSSRHQSIQPGDPEADWRSLYAQGRDSEEDVQKNKTKTNSHA